MESIDTAPVAISYLSRFSSIFTEFGVQPTSSTLLLVIVGLLFLLYALRQRAALRALRGAIVDSDIKHARSIVQSHKVFANEIQRLRGVEKRMRGLEQKVLEISRCQSDNVSYSQVDKLLNLGVNKNQLKDFGFTSAEASLLGLVHDRKH